MATIEFFSENAADRVLRRDGRSELRRKVLAENLVFFIGCRWIAISLLIGFEIVSRMVPQFLDFLNLYYADFWFLRIGLVLLTLNLIYLGLLRSNYFGKKLSKLNLLRFQMLADLVCLTVLVHFAGSIYTPAPFLYVLHIVLACMLFSVPGSLLIAISACLLYGCCLIVDVAGAGFTSVFVQCHRILPPEPGTVVVWGIGCIGLFMAVWLVVSRLSRSVQTHEQELETAFHRLEQTQIEKDQYAIQTTHQLKSPLDAVLGMIKLVNGGYCGEVAEDAKTSLGRIEDRVRSLATLVLDILKLSRARAGDLVTTSEAVDMKELVAKCLAGFGPVARELGVAIEERLDGFIVTGVAEHYEMLCGNLIANALHYSHRGGTVEVELHPEDNGTGMFRVSDRGIGIREKELPFIFDEFYRSPRAVSHNRHSTGVGLSIVKTVALNHGLKIAVDSVPDKGTTFTVWFTTQQTVPAAATG